ncbi:hypothetical protein EVB27_070 [Rhizobium phage RHph_TM16]|nr:hypothetical protein EVB27_070 [Rhizobium phage RHph_TM16]
MSNKNEVTLSKNDAEVICAALRTVCNTGGGSYIWSLLGRLECALNVNPHTDEFHARVTAMSNTVVREWLEFSDMDNIVDEPRGGPIILQPLAVEAVNLAYGRY